MEFEWNETVGRLDDLFVEDKTEYNIAFDDGVDFLKTVITSDEFATELYKRYGYKIDVKHIALLLRDKYRV